MPFEQKDRTLGWSEAGGCDYPPGLSRRAAGAPGQPQPDVLTGQPGLSLKRNHRPGMRTERNSSSSSSAVTVVTFD